MSAFIRPAKQQLCSQVRACALRDGGVAAVALPCTPTHVIVDALPRLPQSVGQDTLGNLSAGADCPLRDQRLPSPRPPGHMQPQQARCKHQLGITHDTVGLPYFMNEILKLEFQQFVSFHDRCQRFGSISMKRWHPGFWIRFRQLS